MTSMCDKEQNHTLTPVAIRHFENGGGSDPEAVTAVPERSSVHGEAKKSEPYQQLRSLAGHYKDCPASGLFFLYLLAEYLLESIVTSRAERALLRIVFGQ